MVGHTELAESALVTQWQPGLECHRPNGTPPSLQTAKDAAGRDLAKILRSTTGLLENTEKEA